MAQCHVIKIVKDRILHVVEAADMLLLRVALLGSDTGGRHILMGDGNVPGPGIDM